MKVHILRAGTHGGQRFDPETLRDIAESYDRGRHDAPAVIGHPKTDAPAHGWIDRLEANDEGLFAHLDDVDPAFAELVKAGRYRHVSVALYRPGGHGNPRGGDGFYLRHLGFLGAQPPEVKGLKPIALAETDEALEFAGLGPTRSIAMMFRGLREWFISKHGAETADTVLPNWSIEDVERSATLDADMALAESRTEEVTMPPNDQDVAAREAKLAAEQAELEAQRAELEAQRQAASAEGLRREALEFAEGHVAEGRVTPAEQEALAAIYAALPEDDEPLKLSEGAVNKPARAALRDFVAALPKRVPYGEAAPADRPAAGNVIPLPAGVTLAEDEERAALHVKATEHAAKHGVSYIEAVSAVAAGGV